MDYKKVFRSREIRFKILNALNFVSDELMLKFQYRIKLNRKLNLKKPVRFTEKLQWYKLNYRNPIMQECVDKYSVREFVKSKNLGHSLNELYGVYNTSNDINFELLPNQFVIKTTNGGGGINIIICKNKDSLEIDKVKETIDKWMEPQKLSSGREWAYDGMKPRIVIEKYLINDTNPEAGITDYKFFCFNGIPEYVVVDIDRYIGHKRNFYDKDWNYLEVDSDCPNFGDVLAKPEGFEEMLKTASKLSEDFPFVRVDLYSIQGRVLFGDMKIQLSGGNSMILNKEKLDIIVLMSTYNGEKYLDEQLESIFSQKDINLKVVVRDDGSTDGTKSILNKWALTHPLKWFEGNNIGVGNSFMQLVYEAEKCDYYAFSDQDDVWKPDKLKTAIKKLNTLSQDKPALFYSSFSIVDENLNILYEKVDNIKPYNFGSSLLKFNGIGCSFVFNYAAKKMAENFKSENINMHDAWMFRMTYATGNIVFDNKPYLLYRQHGKNVSSASYTGLKKYKSKLKGMKKFFNGSRIYLVRQILRCCEPYMTDKEKIKILKEISEYNTTLKNRMKITFNKSLKFTSTLDTIIFKIILLIGKA